MSFKRILTPIVLLFSLFCNSSAQNNVSITHYTDQQCQTIISLVDSSGQILSLAPPYHFSINNQIIQQNNHLATSTFQLASTNTNGIVNISVTDGNFQVYSTQLNIPCSGGGSNTSPPILVTNVAPSSSCNTCDGSFTATINNPTGSSFIFSIGNGSQITTSNTSFTFNGICHGTYNIQVTDSNQVYSTVVYIPCNNSTNILQAVCPQQLSVDLQGQQAITFRPEDISSSNLADQYFLSENYSLTNHLDFSCQDVGFNTLTLVQFDPFNNSVDTCHALIQITDSLHGCLSNQVSYSEIIGSTTAASNCQTCDGTYQFGGLFNTLDSSLISSSSLNFFWDDGSTSSSRTDLCPNRSYSLTIYDSALNMYNTQVQSSCPPATGIICFDSSLIDPSAFCTGQIAPVCGCDGVTYANACIATNFAGVGQFTLGPCPSLNTTFVQPIVTPNTTSCSSSSLPCDGSINLQVQGGKAPYFIFWADTSTIGPVRTNLCHGIYYATVIDSLANQTQHAIVVPQYNCVWPGDTDENGVVNHQDVLPIGLAYNEVGIPRQDQTITWDGKQAQNWNTVNPILSLPNYKHIDTDGSGTIDSADLIAITTNYARSYARNQQVISGSSPLFVEPSQASPGDTLSLSLIFGDSIYPVNNLYGLSCLIYYDTSIIDASTIQMTVNNSWLGSDLLLFQRNDVNLGRIEVAITRKNGIPITGIGSIAKVDFTIRDDLVMGKVNNTDSTLTSLFNVHDHLAVDDNNQEIGANSFSSGVRIIDVITNTYANERTPLQLFPNPTTSHSFVMADEPIETIEVYNMTGQLQFILYPNKTHVLIHNTSLTSGMYVLHVKTRSNHGILKWIKY